MFFWKRGSGKPQGYRWSFIDCPSEENSYTLWHSPVPPQQKCSASWKMASEKDMHQMEKLNLIMEAGRVGYSTMDSFFYRLFATSGFAPKMADEREQMVLSSEIESLFCDSLMRRGMGDQLIIAARILRTDPDNLWKPLADDQIVERCSRMWQDWRPWCPDERERRPEEWTRCSSQ